MENKSTFNGMYKANDVIEYCPFCGKKIEVENNVRYCQYCGKELPMTYTSGMVIVHWNYPNGTELIHKMGI